MSKPHKHAELIKAWADGAEIEVYNLIGECWYPTTTPLWDELNQYRIKPELKKLVFYLYTYKGAYQTTREVPVNGHVPGNDRWKHVNTFEHIVEE